MMMSQNLKVVTIKIYLYAAFIEVFTATERQSSNPLVLETKLCGYGKKSVDLSARVKCLAPDDVQNFGEDAGFFNEAAVIVADGVGGWARKGVDPSHYSFGIADHIAQNPDLAKTTLQQVIDSYAAITQKGTMGSTTLLYSRLHENNLQVYNLGDCAVIVIRDGKTLYASGTQQGRFNYPYQLSVYGQFKPDQAIVTSVPLMKGDIVVSASDGVWDNVFEYEMRKEVLRFYDEVTEQYQFDEAVHEILELVNKRSKDDDVCSPFCMGAKEHGMNYPGGKVDDSTIAISVVR